MNWYALAPLALAAALVLLALADERRAARRHDQWRRDHGFPPRRP